MDGDYVLYVYDLGFTYAVKYFIDRQEHVVHIRSIVQGHSSM